MRTLLPVMNIKCNVAILILFSLVLSGCKKYPLADAFDNKDSVTNADSINFAIPNSFTPNGDGQDDYFYPVFGLNPATAYTVDITIKVDKKTYYQGSGPPGWDGKYNGKTVAQGACKYFISITDSSTGKATTAEGYVAAFPGSCFPSGYASKCTFGEGYFIDFTGTLSYNPSLVAERGCP